MRYSRPRPEPTSVAPSFTRADQRQLVALVEHFEGNLPSELSLASLERLLNALPALQQRLSEEQQRLIEELDRSEEALQAALQQLRWQFESHSVWNNPSLDTIEQLQTLEERATQLAQHAAEVALRVIQRCEALAKVSR
jgi:hypothetical protein